MLRNLPSVSELLNHSLVQVLIAAHGRRLVTEWVRTAIEDDRRRLRGESRRGESRRDESRRDVDILPINAEPEGDSPETRESDRSRMRDEVAERVARLAADAECLHIGNVINATGVVLHTGLGRAPLSAQAKQALIDASGATNVEVDVATGDRRYRGYQLDSTWQLLTGCESSLLLNNNAAATLLTLQALCAGREVIISRGELIEIGGSFRLPEIFRLSGAILREVGTTNRTSLDDYAAAIGPDTAAIMHVHPSNFRVVGFTSRPAERELFELAHRHDLIAIDDIGSGSMFDLTSAGLPSEPTFADSISFGADVVLGSGDKLLGGPQCGIIIGKREHVDRCRQHPLARAVRVDKLTIAALGATLDAYARDAAACEIPTLIMLTSPQSALRLRALSLVEEIDAVDGLTLVVRDDVAAVGGGSLPAVELPTSVTSLRHDTHSADELARRLRTGRIRVFSRIQKHEVLLDLRSVLAEDDARLALAVRLIRPDQPSAD